MELMTQEQREKMIANANEAIEGRDNSDKMPTVRLFTPYGAATWLLSELEVLDDGQRRAFGLCDLGMGMPELGYVMIEDLEDLKRHIPLGVERDLHWEPNHTLVEYAELARSAGTIPR